jgi:membrane protease YdiL (CAAX protease family)
MLKEGNPGMTAPIRFIDVFWLFLGANLAALCVFLVVSVGYPTRSIMAGEIVFSAWILLGYRGIVGDREWEPLGARFGPVSGRVVWASAALGVGLVIFFSLLTQMLSSFGVDIRESAPSPLLPHRLSQLPLAILILAMLAPLAEEVLFRGLLLDWLRQRVVTWVAVVVLSAVFGLLHDNDFKNGVVGWLAFAYRFLVGIVASILAVRYRSLRPSVAFHGGLNGFICVASAIQQGQ